MNLFKKSIIALMFTLAIQLLLIKINQYNIISFISGILYFALYLIVINDLEG